MSRTFTPVQLIEQSIVRRYHEELWSPMCKAVKRYRLIRPGDRIAYASRVYDEKEMRSRYGKVRSKITMRNGFDILVTHAPAKGFGDLPDLPHNGFDTFNEIMYRHKPKYMLHGHVHK